MHTLTRSGTGRAALAALAVVLAGSGYTAPLAAAAGITLAVHLYRRIRRWWPPPGILACAGLALMSGVAA